MSTKGKRGRAELGGGDISTGGLGEKRMRISAMTKQQIIGLKGGLRKTEGDKKLVFLGSKWGGAKLRQFYRIHPMGEVRGKLSYKIRKEEELEKT